MTPSNTCSRFVGRLHDMKPLHSPAVLIVKIALTAVFSALFFGCAQPAIPKGSTPLPYQTLYQKPNGTFVKSNEIRTEHDRLVYIFNVPRNWLKAFNNDYLLAAEPLLRRTENIPNECTDGVDVLEAWGYESSGTIGFSVRCRRPP